MIDTPTIKTRIKRNVVVIEDRSAVQAELLGMARELKGDGK